MRLFVILVSLSIPNASFTAYKQADAIEMIVTDENALITGVPIDYNYNESYTGSEMNSVPGCPKSIVGYPWVYFGSRNNFKCFLAGERGPCPEGQKIFIERGSPFGFCNCDCFEGIKRENNIQFCSSTTNEVAFHPDVKKCFVLFERGPCNKDEWLVKVDTSNSSIPYTKCEKRKCDEGEIAYEAVLGDANFYCSSPFSSLEEVAAFTLPNECERAGMKYNPLSKKCVKKFNFIF